VTKENLNKISKGILEGLEDDNNLKAKEDKSKSVNNPKSKRSFMLTDNQIKMLYELKVKINT